MVEPCRNWIMRKRLNRIRCLPFGEIIGATHENGTEAIGNVC